MRDARANTAGNIYFLVKRLKNRLIDHQTAKDSGHFYQRKWDTLEAVPDPGSCCAHRSGLR